jgi:CDP-3, 6-dideoxy-D-glycero-L-glycero-4-hexulose-4-reductase
MKIAIIGALGFVGKNLSQALVAHGHEVIGITTNKQSKSQLPFACLDVSSFYANQEEHQSSFDVVVNLAARRSSKLSPLSDKTVFEYTLDIPKALIVFAAKENALVLNTSTYIQNFNGVNGETVDSYGAAKQEMTKFLSEYSLVHPLNVIDLYLFTIYGHGDRATHLVPSLVNAAVTGEPIQLSPGLQLINLLNIEDLIMNISNVLNWSNLKGYQRFYMWDDGYMTVRDLVHTLESVTMKDVNCDWGAREYAGHEMFNPWPIPMEKFPQFKREITLETGLTKLWNALEVNQ